MYRNFEELRTVVPCLEPQILRQVLLAVHRRSALPRHFQISHSGASCSPNVSIFLLERRYRTVTWCAQGNAAKRSLSCVAGDLSIADLSVQVSILQQAGFLPTRVVGSSWVCQCILFVTEILSVIKDLRFSSKASDFSFGQDLHLGHFARQV